MKAPDKIYVVPDFIEGLSLERKDFDDEVCYIRKEALLEWAKGKQYESLTIVADNFWQEVVDKLNSL